MKVIFEGFIPKLSNFIKATVIILFPFSCLRILRVFNLNNETTTLYARNLTFIFNWLLLLCIFWNDFYKTVKRKETALKIRKTFYALFKTQNMKENVFFLLACAAKTLYLGFYFLYYNSKKYIHMVKPSLIWWEISLVVILLSPYFVVVFASSKIYFVNHIIQKCFQTLARDLNRVDIEEKIRIKSCAVDFRRLNKLFIEFNNTNAITIPTLIFFSIVNIVFEVRNYD